MSWASINSLYDLHFFVNHLTYPKCQSLRISDINMRAVKKCNINFSSGLVLTSCRIIFFICFVHSFLEILFLVLYREMIILASKWLCN